MTPSAPISMAVLNKHGTGDQRLDVAAQAVKACYSRSSGRCTARKSPTAD